LFRRLGDPPVDGGQLINTSEAGLRDAIYVRDRRRATISF